MAKHPPSKKTFVYERSLEMFNESWQTVLNKLPEYPDSYLHLGCTETDRVFGYQFLGGLDKETLTHYLYLMHQTAIAHYRFVTSEGKRIKFTIDHKTFETEGQFTPDNFRFYYWLRHLCVAVLLKDQAAIQRLCKIDKLWFRKVPMGNNVFDDALMDMIIGVFTGDKNLKQHVMAVMKTSDQKNLTDTEAKFAYNILMPFSELLTMAITKVDEATYQKAWLNAVKSHKEYWSSNKRLSEEHNGWISFPITAVSSLIYDQKGFKLPKQSPYVPEWLVYGDFELQPSVGEDFFEGEI